MADETISATGVHPGKMTPDQVSAKLDFSASIANGGGYMHGGSLISALDFAMSAVTRSTDTNELISRTIEMKRSFIRPAARDVEKLRPDASTVPIHRLLRSDRSRYQGRPRRQRVGRFQTKP